MWIHRVYFNDLISEYGIPNHILRDYNLIRTWWYNSNYFLYTISNPLGLLEYKILFCSDKINITTIMNNIKNNYSIIYIDNDTLLNNNVKNKNIYNIQLEYDHLISIINTNTPKLTSEQMLKNMQLSDFNYIIDILSYPHLVHHDCAGNFLYYYFGIHKIDKEDKFVFSIYIIQLDHLEKIKSVLHYKQLENNKYIFIYKSKYVNTF